MNNISYYLRIPGGYCRWLGGLRWSAKQDAIEYEDVGTFAFSGQLGLFLEGFTAVRSLIHFGYILHLLHLLGHGKIAPPMEAVALRKVFREAGKPMRNAGALCGFLCETTPPLAEAVDAGELCRRLSSTVALPIVYLSWFVDPFGRHPEEPPIGPAAFESEFLARLEKLRPEVLGHWLRHGRGPLGEGGRKIAEEIAAVKPRTLAAALAALVQSPRLSGAVPYVAQLVSALTLPPRRLAEEELPTGGYADVATRGEPERILPSQFAMDDMEFIRRFAANELLYFRREEPQAQTREELIVLLDQGVRTWGTVRLLLSAAALALGKLAARKKLALLFGGTSSEGRLVDPVKVDDATLSKLLGASDLSANPGLALECVLEQPSQTPRDIVLLTQRRNLDEPDVRAAAQRAGENTRLFSVAVDAAGQVQLVALKHGTPVKLAQLQVDLNPETEAPLAAPKRAAKSVGEPLPAWMGDVESIGFPFRLGITDRIRADLFDFDYAGEWLLAVGHNEMLHGCRVDGSHAEVLPRALVAGNVLTRIEVVCGVAGGFVVVGQFQDRLAVVHYDFSRRLCRVHRLPPNFYNQDWKTFYFRECHSFVIAVGTKYSCVLDLSMDKSLNAAAGTPISDRAKRALTQSMQLQASPPRLLVARSNMAGPAKEPTIHLDEATGKVSLDGISPPWQSFVPAADGKPMLQGWEIGKAVCCGNILAALCFNKVLPIERVVRLFRGPEGQPLYEYHCSSPHDGFALSRDSRLLAVQTAKGRTLLVHDIGRDCAIIFGTPRVRISARLILVLADWAFLAKEGDYHYGVRWDRGELQLSCWRGQYTSGSRLFEGLTSVAASVKTKKAPHLLNYDPKRWIAGAVGDVQIAADCFGHIAVLDLNNKLVCLFRVARQHIAAWMPDGTRFGPPCLSGGPGTPEALQKIAKALREACERGKGRTA